jgi:hypothetical protein
MDLRKLNEAGDPTGVESPSAYGEKKAKKSLKGEDDPKREEEGLEEAHDKDWGMGKDEKSRTRPGEEDYTGHKGDESHTHPGEEDYEDDESMTAEDHAMLAMKAVQDLASAAGVELHSRVSGPSDAEYDDDDEEEELEERRARGRKGPHIRGPEDPRLRESILKLQKAGLSRRQIKEFLTKAYNKALRS